MEQDIHKKMIFDQKCTFRLFLKVQDLSVFKMTKVLMILTMIHGTVSSIIIEK